MKLTNFACFRYILPGLVLALALGTADVAWAAGADMAGNSATKSVSSSIHDAWIRGKVEMALLLNRYLNGFRIHTDVERSAVKLTGTVDTDIDRDLAGQIAEGIDGVRSVRNDLKVVPDDKGRNSAASEKHRKFLQYIDDVSTTARVKSKFLLNKNVSGTRINVDTSNGIVTLHGEVDNGEQRELALKIAANTGSVRKVIDKLKVRDTVAKR